MNMCTRANKNVLKESETKKTEKQSSDQDGSRYASRNNYISATMRASSKICH